MPYECSMVIANKLTQGVQLVTEYSGSGQPELVFGRLIEYFEDLAVGIEPRVRFSRASDIEASCRQLLMSLGHDSMCVMGDVFTRQTTSFQSKVRRHLITHRKAWQDAVGQEAKERVRSKWLSGLALIISSDNAPSGQPAHCYKHGCDTCPARPRAIDGFALEIMVAGIVCTDWSSRGKGASTLGKSAQAWAGFMNDVFHMQPTYCCA